MKHAFIFLSCLAASSLAAADNTVESQPALSVPPTPIVTAMPNVSSALTANPGEVQLRIEINEFGFVTDARVSKSTNPLLNEPCLEALRRWRFQPAQKDGVAISASFILPFKFGNDTFDNTPGITARPKPRREVAPLVPDSLQHVSGSVTIAVQLDNQGKITGTAVAKSSHEELNAATLSAVQQWEFSPAYVNGKAVPSSIYVPFEYVGRPMPVESVAPKPVVVDNSELKPLRQGSPNVPAALAELSGEVEIEFIVDSKGYVAEAKTLTATQPALGELARQTVLNWKFTPIVKNGVAVPVKVVQPIRFGQGTVSIARIDRLPEVKSSVSPDLPASLQGASGYANVIFEIDAKGQVTSVEVKDASHEEFKAAALAAARQWTFKPALRAGGPVSARVAIPFVFGKK